MFVYAISNEINDKKYVGITTCSIQKRWREHKHAANKGSNKPLYNAMRLYGVDKFKIEIIDSTSTKEELGLLEAKYISQYKAYVRDGGYNLTLGGEGVVGADMPKGETNASSKLSDSAVVFIRAPENFKYKNDTLVAMVRDLFGITVSRDCLRDARRGDTWTHLNDVAPPYKRTQGYKSEPMSDVLKAKAKLTLDKHRAEALMKAKATIKERYEGKKHYNSRLSENEVRDIFYSTESLAKTADKYGVSKKSVLLIKQKATHKYVTEVL